MATARRSEEGETHIPVNEESIACLLAHAVRVQGVFESLREVVEPSAFSREGEVPFRYIWEACISLRDKSGSLPNQAMLASHANSLLLQVPNTRNFEQVADDIDGYVEAFYSLDDTDLIPDYALHIAKAVGDRRIQDDLKAKITMSEATGDVADMSVALNQAVNQAHRVRSVTSGSLNVVTSLLPDSDTGWGEEDAAPIPLGVSFMDTNTGGGLRAGEVHTLIGPTGAGKTLLAIQSSIYSARHLESRNMDPGLTNFYFSYESGLAELRARVVSCAAEIHVSRAPRSNAQFAALSTENNLQEYEIRYYESGVIETVGNRRLGERERLEAERHLINNRFALLDFCGSRETGNRGYGGIPEITSTIRSYMNAGRRPHLVIVDYAGSCVQKNLVARGVTGTDHLRFELSTFVDRLASEVAAPFGCAVIVLHQMAGQDSKRSPGADFDHTMAKECTMFSERAWFAHVLGTKDRATNCLTFNTTKTRLGPPMPRTLLRIDGDIGRHTDVTPDYTVDGGSIVPLRVAEAFTPPPGRNRRSIREIGEDIVDLG